MRPTRARFAEVVRSEPVDVGLACLLIGGELDPDFDVEPSLELLDLIATQGRPAVPSFNVGDMMALASMGMWRATPC